MMTMPIRQNRGGFGVAEESFPEACWRPSADLYRTRSGWLVKMDLAGVRPEDVDVRVQGKTLRVSGIRRDALAEDGLEHYHMEISYSSFEREIELPCSLDECEVGHEFRHGMFLVNFKTE